MARNVKHTQHLSVSTDLIKHDNGSVTTSFGFLPSTGLHNADSILSYLCRKSMKMHFYEGPFVCVIFVPVNYLPRKTLFSIQENIYVM